ncbi:MAG: sulfotransferase [Phycisphaeraceae bacterium]|nr:sulfotransferase [Phycisphaeraceae bacterium]
MILPRMDLLIAGMGRAGTTALANLLTTPPDRWVLIEPGLTRDGVGDHVFEQARRFGPPVAVSEAQWRAGGDRETGLERFARTIGPGLSALRGWGVKEVNPTGLDEIIRVFEPRKVLLAVRDIRDCAISVLEKSRLHAAERRSVQSDEWLARRLTDAGAALVRLRSRLDPARVRTVQYERFTTDPLYRAALEDWLNWPLTGDPGRCMDLFGREYEVARHAGTVTASSVDRREREQSPEALRFAAGVERAAAAYQQAFGYARHAAEVAA